MSLEISTIPEPPNVRVRSGRLNFLFRDTTPGAIERLYDTFVKQARLHFEQRWTPGISGAFGHDEFEFLTRELTLYWLYFYIVNRRVPKVTSCDWEHPHSRRIIRRHVESCLGPTSKESFEVAARLAGMTVQDYVAWREADDRFLEMF